MSLACCIESHCTPATLAPAHTPCLFSIDLHTVRQHLVVLKLRWNWWSGSNGEGGAVLEVGRSKEGKLIVMTVVLFFGEDVLRLVCGYAPQSGQSLEEKQSFMMTRRLTLLYQP